MNIKEKLPKVIEGFEISEDVFLKKRIDETENYSLVLQIKYFVVPLGPAPLRVTLKQFARENDEAIKNLINSTFGDFQ